MTQRWLAALCAMANNVARLKGKQSMEHTQIVAARVIQNLERQLGAVRYEMRVWYEAAGDRLKSHSRQLEEVKVWTEALLPESLDSLRALRAGPGFFEATYRTQAVISAALEVWEYYRDRFEIYFGPLAHYQAWIAGAEWVAADCYQLAMRRAKQLGLDIPSQRITSPLMQLATAQQGLPQSEEQLLVSSPYTLPRQFAPVPIIVLPATLMANSWGFLVLHHEVGHDVLADLGWHDKALAVHGWTVVQPQLLKQGVGIDRAARWVCWMSELYADCFALLLAGPAFVGYMIETLALPRAVVIKQSATSIYPAPYLRIHILLKILESYGSKRPGSPKPNPKVQQAYQRLASAYREMWESLYNPDGDLNATFADYFDDIEPVIATLLDAPFFKTTSGEAVPFRALCAYGPAEHGLVTRVAGDLALENSQGVKEQITPCLLASAARLAFEKIAASAAPERLDVLHQHVLDAVETYKPSPTLKAHGAEDAQRVQTLAVKFREALLRSMVKP